MEPSKKENLIIKKQKTKQVHVPATENGLSMSWVKIYDIS